MKKTLTIIAAVLIIFSCDDGLLPKPMIPPGSGNNGEGNSPEFVSATHGEKRSITLSWNHVQNVSLYYIYRAHSPLDTFVRCAETETNQFKFNVSPGSTVFYKVSAVNGNGTESAQSNYVKGTSLAQPVISDITDIIEDSAAVTWYMENVSDDTYRNNLLYTVYCFNGTAEVAQIVLDGSVLTENKAVFTGLNANTNYEYQVEAYLRTDQSAGEKSDKMDAATARRLRPGPPVNLRAGKGTAKDEIVLEFELPDMVDIALGDNMYDPKPLYFVISRCEYSISGNNEYFIACPYMGSIADNAAKLGGVTFTGYSPGSVVTWTDSSVIRGVEYEYLVQSYVDDTNKIISSDSSKAGATGWAMNEGDISFGRLNPTINAAGTEYEKAELPVIFIFDPKGITYTYKLYEIIEPIDDGNTFDPGSVITREIGPLTYGQISAYTAEMHFNMQTTENHSGRGIYSYKIGVWLNNTEIDIFETIGKIEVSENTQPIIVEGFSVQDGFTDKFVIKWDNYENRKYTLYVSDYKSTGYTEIVSFNDTPNDSNTGFTEGFVYEYKPSGDTANLTKYFAIRPWRNTGEPELKSGQMVYASSASQTMGVPELIPGSGAASYSSITVTWKGAQKADTYRIKYRYADENEASAETTDNIGINELSKDAQGNFIYQLKPFGGNTIDAAKAGKEIQVKVEALNVSLQTAVGGDEIVTASDMISNRLVGPALLDAAASKAASAQEIDISWNSVSGAAGYYIFRRQFNMNNTAEIGTEAIVYYVPASASGDINVTGKNLVLDTSNSKTDTSTVKVAASFNGSRYLLKDLSMTDGEYDGTYNRHIPAYKDQQNDLVQGFPYRYYIVPVIDRGGSPEPLTSINFTYTNNNIASYAIQENGINIQFTNAAAFEQEGFAIGFGQNVTATKGTYASTGNTNDGIKIIWEAPPRLSTVSGFTPQYALYRKAYNASTWTTLTTLSGTEYIDLDTSAERGIAYEYIVGISNGGAGNYSQPQSNRRFIDQCSAIRDNNNRPYMQGYMLKIVRMQSVSRDQRMLDSEFAEEVTWYSEGIDNGSMDYRYGIDGYTIFVMNRNIDTNWHAILDVPAETIHNQMVLNTLVTNSMGGGGLLKVWRDYKHFFKVRSYVLNNDQKIYSPDPGWTYQYRFGTTETAHIAQSELMQNDYVKWGARQITAREFAIISTMYVARGVQRNRGGTWTSNLAWSSSNASTNNGGSGYVRNQSNAMVDVRNWEFRNYKDDLQTRDGRGYITFLTVDGNMWMATRASGWPQRYGRATNNYRENRLWITGPWDTPGLYSGAIHFGGNGTRDIERTVSNGEIHVIYPSGTSQQTVIVHGENDTPLAWDYGSSNSQNRHRLDDDAWR